MIITIFSILFSVILVFIVFMYILRKQFAKIRGEFEALKLLVEENKKRNDLLVRVTTSHEHFIDDVKKRTEDLAIRNRRNGAR